MEVGVEEVEGIENKGVDAAEFFIWEVILDEKMHTVILKENWSFQNSANLGLEAF